MVEGHRHFANRGHPLGADQLLLDRRLRFSEGSVATDSLNDLREQLPEIGILDDIVLGASAERRRGDRLVALAGHHHHRGRIRPAQKPGERLDAGSVGQLVVKEDEVSFGSQLDRVGRVGPDRDSHIAGELEEFPG